MKVKCNNCGLICDENEIIIEWEYDDWGDKCSCEDICPKCKEVESFEEYESCNKSCSPSDWYKGGKCDLNGCYHE